jgi:hypothetical protein
VGVREIAVELYGVAPNEFVAARDTKVRELRAAGDRDLAAAVAKLRRPSAAHSALNVAAREHAEVIAAWADAADALRDAQQALADGRQVDLRGALATLRSRSADMRSVVAELSPDLDLALILNEIANSATTTEALRAGLLGASLEPTGRAEPPSAPPKRHTAKASARQRDDEGQRRRRGLDTARASLDEAAEKLETARDEATRADELVAAATAATTAATEAVAAAREALSAAEDRHAEAERARRDALRDQAAATKQLGRASRAHDQAVARLDRTRPT